MKADIGKTAVYIRVSTLHQNESGQREDIEKYLAAHGISGAVWYTDKASGTKSERPAFLRLQRDIFAGKIKTIIVWKLDRLSRSIRDGITVLDEWLKRGIRIVSVTQQFDLNGSVGKLISTVLIAVAEMENELRKERQAAGIAAAKRFGKYKGRKAGTVKKRPERALQLRLYGLRINEIAAAMRVSKSTVYNYLKRTGL
ncbi:DNA-invertase [Planctomycetales bacterium]|nr:DNA-invertase [Planctomycetales bacterium]